MRDTHGGESILYYGGGGQGNHLPGAYARATRAALGSVYASNALAQEKTGEFWVDGQLFGAPSCHTTPDFEHAEVAVFIGKNPWQSHGFPRARAVLREIAKDPARTLVVIDPRRTETAELADYYLQVRPGMDAFCLAALLAALLEAGGVDRAFLAERTTGAEAVLDAIAAIPIADYCARAGVAEADVRAVARAHRRRRERLDPRGPRHPAGAAQHAELVPREAALSALGPLRRARRHEPAHALRRADRQEQGRPAHADRRATASSAA